MSTTNLSIPPGQYSAGSIQVRAVDGDNSSEVRPLGPMISPYTPANVNVTMLNSSEENVIYRVNGIGQIGGTAQLFTPANQVDPAESITINPYGYFEFIIDYPLTEPDAIPLEGYFLRMVDPADESIVSDDIPLDQTVATYVFGLGDNPDPNTVNIDPMTVPAIYSLDGGNTWSEPVDSVGFIPIEGRLYPPGMIRIRALDEDGLPTGPSYSAGGTISPYVIDELNTTTANTGDPAVTNWVITGTGDIGSTISLINNTNPSSPIASEDVGPYGRFTITVPVEDLDPNNSYSLTMNNPTTNLETTQPFDIPNLTPPEASYVLDESPPVPQISVVNDGRTIQYTTNGGLKWDYA